VLAVGPVPYLYYLHQMRLLDMALMAFIAISLAFPVFIWMRPHWQDMLKLESPRSVLARASYRAHSLRQRFQL
jgi:two-component system sensor histidine kinase RstB